MELPPRPTFSAYSDGNDIANGMLRDSPMFETPEKQKENSGIIWSMIAETQYMAHSETTVKSNKNSDDDNEAISPTRRPASRKLEFSPDQSVIDLMSESSMSIIDLTWLNLKTKFVTY